MILPLLNQHLLSLEHAGFEAKQRCAVDSSSLCADNAPCACSLGRTSTSRFLGGGRQGTTRCWRRAQS
jgi:hypothetical protein